MLNWSDVLFYIKGRLALPSMFIEKEDDELKRWIKLTALREFSDYIPDIAWTAVDPTSTIFQTNDSNVFKFFDAEELEILGVRNYYYSDSGYFATGHPVFPVFGGAHSGNCMTGSELANFALKSMQSNMYRKFSYWGYTGKFLRPNKVRILPEISDAFIIEYERMQPEDLRNIPAEHSRSFMELALAEIMLWIGSIRTHYGNGQIQTPFGEIPLQGDTIKSEGQDLKREVIERLREVSIPGVYVDIN